MGGNIPGWDSEIERSFKEVLFRFLEEIQSTKAALYLLTTEGSYRLATHYGFRKRDLLSTEHVIQDPLVRKVRELRTQALVINHPNEFPEISDYLEGAGTARILLVPLYGGSRVLGFVDARDKGRKRDFDPPDARAAEVISQGFLKLMEHARMYDDLGVVEDSTGTPKATTRQRSNVSLPAVDLGPVATLIDARGMRHLHHTAHVLARIQHVVAVAITVVDRTHAASLLVSGEISGDIDMDALQRHQTQALRQTEVTTPDHANWHWEVHRIPDCGMSSSNRIIATAVILSSPNWTLVASVIARGGMGVAAELLERVSWESQYLADLVETRKLRWSLARRLLAPDQREFPELEAHSLAVAQLSWRLAQSIGLDDNHCDEAAVAGLLHDIGMREIDYDNLYSHPAPSSDERSRYRQHVVIGEKLLASSGLEAVALAVRHHHERWDGKGYPDRLPGVAIPHLARLVHVAEVFDVLTGSHSYRRPVGTQRALSIIKAVSGQQFDPELVEVLARVVE